MANSKIETYIGFCIKSRKIALGSGAISVQKEGVYLIILDGTAAKNSKRLALKFKRRFSCPLLICKSGFDDIVNKPFCKLAAICDKNLAQAIKDCEESNFELYVEEGVEI